LIQKKLLFIFGTGNGNLGTEKKLDISYER